jgi:hypothetical protein
MKRLFSILWCFTVLLAGLQAVVSCSETIDLSDITTSSSSIAQSSSSDAQSSSSDAQSSSSQTPPITIDLPRSGHYESGFSITVPAETELGIVACEKNGTVPNENSSIQSGSTLNLTETTILQCAYFKNGISNKIVMRTYIVGRLPNLPIVSIAVNPVDMFTSSTALYKSSHKPSQAADCGSAATFYTEEEIPIYVDFFEKGANLAWSYPAGISIHGGCSRQWKKKSVIVSFRESYGQKNLKYPLFPDYPNLTKFKHFMLRNNGNNYPYDYIRDMLMTSLTEGLDIDYQKGRAVVVYYNGEYYGIHNLRERANSDYFETNYNINEDYIDLVKVDNGGVVSRGSDDDYQSIVSWLEGIAVLNDGNLNELEQRIDLNNFTNHFQSRIFYKDCDWPGKNMKRWRSNLMRTKWRWLLYDTDHGFGSWGSNYSGCGTMQYITATNGSSWPNPPHSTFLLRKLLTNQGYKNAFINRFSLLIATYFTPARVNEKRNELLVQINSEIQYDQAKYGTKNENELPSTMVNFISSRPSAMRSDIESFFSLGSPVALTLSVNGNGKILVHNLPLPNASATFNAYPSVPIILKAEGAGFKGWSDGETKAERTVSITSATTLTANF